MAGQDASSSSDSDKIFGITNIKSFISVTLDMEEHNYALWRLMFEMHCNTWEVDGFLDGTTIPKGDGDKAWFKRDNLIKMWIYNTITPSLLQMVMKKGDTARQLWKALEDLFQSNRDAKAMQLNEDLRNTRLGDRTITEYCHKMKYAHRKCVQRWCNEKGNTICEICLQPFKPDYTSPPPLSHYGGVPMNFRGNWEISRRDLYNLQFSAMVGTNHDSLESEFDDYITPRSRSILCCRIVAIFLHMLRFIGILLPICIMARAFTAVWRRRQLDRRDLMADEENELPQAQPQPHFIHAH